MPAGPSILRVRDASGGLNVRDAASALAPSESPDLFNVTLDERGGVAKRLGYEKENPTAFDGGLVKNVFYWKSGGHKITQAGAKLYEDDTTTAFKTFTTSARCGFADFLGVLYFIHPVDGLFTYDGATVTAAADPDAPTGDVLFPWQNKLWAAGDGARVTWSAIADGTAWDAADFNDLREKDGEKVVCLRGASGESVATGAAGLLAFKRESAYRITDSGTGAYVTIDAGVGAASALSAITLNGRVYVVNQQGVYSTDGVNAMREESGRVRPLFSASRLNLGQLELFAAGTAAGRAFFSVVEAGETENSLAFEYHPDQRWIVARSDAMSCYATFADDDEYLIGGSPSVSGQVYHLNSGGSDDGTAITSRWQSRWFEPADGLLAALIRLRLLGRTEGAATMYVRKNHAIAGGDSRTLTISGTSVSYDDDLLYEGGALYGPTRLLEYQDHFSLGTCKAFSIVIEETSSLVASAPQYLRQGVAPEVGAWAFYGFDLTFVPLGLA